MVGRFQKMHGLGNDFVVIDARDETVVLSEARARAIADRALAGHDLAHAVGDVLARHLDQSERRDLDDVDLAAVLLQLMHDPVQAIARAFSAGD